MPYHFMLFHLSKRVIWRQRHAKRQGSEGGRLALSFPRKDVRSSVFYEMTQTSKKKVPVVVLVAHGTGRLIRRIAPLQACARMHSIIIHARARLFYSAAMWKIAAFAPRRTAHKANICSRTQFQPRFRYHNHAAQLYNHTARRPSLVYFSPESYAFSLSHRTTPLVFCWCISFTPVRLDSDSATACNDTKSYTNLFSRES